MNNELHITEHMPEKELFELLHRTIIEKEGVTSMGQILQRSARVFSDEVALIFEGRSVTYKALYYYSILLSKKLQARGVKARDRVLLLYENSIAFYVAYFAIVQLGAIVAPLNIFLKEPELVHIIGDAKPALLICSSERAAKIKQFSAQLPPILDETEIELHATVPPQLPEFIVTPLNYDEMAALLYTSGTTGFPKGVMLSSKNIFTNVFQVIGRFGITQKQRVIAVLPLFHSLPENVCIWSSLLMGSTVIVIPKIDRHSLLRGLAQKPTIFVGVPAIFGLLALLKKAPLTSINYFFSGGDALPDKIRAAFALVYRRKICNGYGISEASPVVSVDMEDVTEPTSNTGRPLYGVKVAIRDENQKELPENQIGSIWLAGDTIMLGYYQAPEVTKSCIINGWFNTGDLGYLDVNGKLVITGREKDLIVNKGIKIYPQEVENVILLDQNVISVGVVALNDAVAGQVPLAYVQLRSRDPEAQDRIRELCIKNLAPYKVPRVIIADTKELPTTATGKVDKKVLRVWVAELEKKK